MSRAHRTPKATQADSYDHPGSTVPLRPDVGTQAQFKKKKPPQKYRYDSSLSPALDWDAQNPAREQGEEQLAAARDQLRLCNSSSPSWRKLNRPKPPPRSIACSRSWSHRLRPSSGWPRMPCAG